MKKLDWTKGNGKKLMAITELEWEMIVFYRALMKTLNFQSTEKRKGGKINVSLPGMQ
jgi:hypothetical protein